MPTTQQPPEPRAQLDPAPGTPGGDAGRTGLQRTPGLDVKAFRFAVHHELRTPANTLVGMCWLLHRSGLSPLQQGYVRELQAASRQLLDLVDQLFDGSEPGDQAPAAPSQGRLAVGQGAHDPLAPAPVSGSGLPDTLLDEASWLDLRVRLARLLAEADTDCIALARRHDSLLRGHLGVQYHALTHALDRFDFELALQLLGAAGGRSVR